LYIHKKKGLQLNKLLQFIHLQFCKVASAIVDLRIMMLPI